MYDNYQHKSALVFLVLDLHLFCFQIEKKCWNLDADTEPAMIEKHSQCDADRLEFYGFSNFYSRIVFHVFPQNQQKSPAFFDAFRFNIQL